MTATDIIREVESAGGVLSLNGDRIRYELPEEAASLVDDLRRHKPDVLRLLRRQFLAHLLPFLGKRVWSPAGPGKLLLVEDYVTVGFDDGTKMRWYDPTAVIPYA